MIRSDDLRREVREKYRTVAAEPTAQYHFHTGRGHALRLGYPKSALDRLPERATEAFAGVGNPFFWGFPEPGEKVVDLGSGAGMDSFLAALSVGPAGQVIGVDMTPEMIERSSRLAAELGLENVDFRTGYMEKAPVDDGWADVVISNGAINLSPDKVGVYREIERILRPGGRLTIADICVEKALPRSALRDINLWTG
jgi:ubiquinone/menaquinone biosynthesis C-methylase UbiE